MEFLEVLTEGLNRVLLVRGGGREVITIYSWKSSFHGRHLSPMNHPFPLSSVTTPTLSCQCCFKITATLCLSFPLACLIVPPHPTSSIAWYRRLCPSDHGPQFTQVHYDSGGSLTEEWAHLHVSVCVRLCSLLWPKCGTSAASAR